MGKFFITKSQVPISLIRAKVLILYTYVVYTVLAMMLSHFLILMTQEITQHKKNYTNHTESTRILANFNCKSPNHKHIPTHSHHTNDDLPQYIQKIGVQKSLA